MESSNGTSIQDFVDLYHSHIKEGVTKSNQVEFEIRMDQSRIKKSHFDSIFKSLYAHGFVIDTTEYQLKIQPKIPDIPPDFRIEIRNLVDIQEYCQSDMLLDYPKSNFMIKKSLLANKARSIKNPEYGFRSSVQREIHLNDKNSIVQKTKQEWTRCLKSYRYLYRTSLICPRFPNIRIDMSEVRMNRGKDSVKFKESNVLSSSVQYEVEIEVVQNKDKQFKPDDLVYSLEDSRQRVWKVDGIDNNDMMITTEDIRSGEQGWMITSPDKLMLVSAMLTTSIKSSIKYILSGIQNTPYPVPFTKLYQIERQYLSLCKHLNHDKSKHAYKKSPHHFIGPSSFALQKGNLLSKNEDTNSSVVSIKDGFCVTDKADGERKLLYINAESEMYFIDTNLNVQYTGCKMDKKALNIKNTIIDGEHLTVDKYGNSINIYAAFDIYCTNQTDCRSRPFKEDRKQPNRFYANHDTKYKYMDGPSQSRYAFLQEIVGLLNHHITSPLKIQVKQFIFSNPKDPKSIFKCCNTLLAHIDSNKYPYQTDGIIFTSKYMGVNQESVNDRTIKKGKYTWGHSFKWKPPEFNTIDFLTRIKKNASGEQIIHSKKIQGELREYYVVHLFVGYDFKKHGHVNPQEKILQNNYGSTRIRSNHERHYKPIEFQPTNPYDRSAHICHIPIYRDEQGNPSMFTEEKDLIEDDTIIEFRYEKTESDKFNNWVPLRVRYDKTSDYKTNHSNFGNAYHVANSNWQSIHSPISKNMLITGAMLTPETIQQLSIDEQYYNRSKEKSNTVALRNFHNLFVKSSIIQCVTEKQNDTLLLDLAVGKGGDLPKWIQYNVKAVLGIDIAYDNIHNHNDGACARFINAFDKYKKVPICMFIRGDTSKQMNNGNFEFHDDSKNHGDYSLPGSYEILQTLMASSQTPKSQVTMPFLNNHYGLFKDKFDVCSMQFALHYMFENKEKLHTFMMNLSHYTKTGKYFIGTCYNGKKIYEMLKEKSHGEMVELYDDKKRKLWHIKKLYHDDSEVFMDNNESSIGHCISVYQESINLEFEEYLVNFEYFVKVMEDYGFILANDLVSMDGKPLKPLGSFESLFDVMTTMPQVKEFGEAHKMTSKEKQISFLNSYFVFQKQRDIIRPMFDGDGNAPIDFTIGQAKKTNKTIILN